MNRIKNLLKPPIFDDDEKTEQAYILHVILWTLICVPVPYLIFIFLEDAENLNRALVQSAFGEGVNIFLLIFLRRGYVELASVIQVSAFWFFFTVTAITGNGVHAEAYLLGYALVIAIAGILLGRAGAVVFAFLSLSAGGVMAYGQTTGLIHSSFENPPLTTWVVSLLLFPISVVLQHLASRTVRSSLAYARASEERYRLISRVTSDYTFSTKLGPGGSMQLNWVAGAFESMTGYTYDEYVASGGWYAHLHPDDVEKDAQALATLNTNHQVVHDIRTYTKAEEVQWVRVYAHPVWDERQNQLVGIVGAVQDITERKQTEADLIQERDILQIFMDNIPDTVYFKDQESRFVRINKTQAQFLNVNDPQAAIGKTDFDFQPTELAQKFIEEERQIIATNQPIINRVEFNPTADGMPHWLSVTKLPVNDSSGRVVGIIGISRDITDQKLAEEVEQRRRATLEKIVKLGQYVTEVQDVHTTLQRIWHSVRYELNFDRLGIFLYDSEHKVMDGTYGTNHQGEMVAEWDEHISLDDKSVETISFIKALQEENGVYVTHDYEGKHNPPAGHILHGVKDYAAVAAWAGDKPMAVICVDNLITKRPITAEQLEALRLFAGYAGLAIENARLNDTLQKELKQQQQAEEREVRRRVILEKVILLGKQVTEVSDLKTTLIRIWHGVHDDLGFDRLAIFLYDQAEHSVHGSLGTNNQGKIIEEWDFSYSLVQEGPTSFTRALEQPDGVYSTHNFDVEYNIPEGHEMYGVKDFAAVTAWGGDKPVAIIAVDNFPSQRAIAKEQLEALRLFSGYAGLAIENARLNMTLEDDLSRRKELIEELESKNAELERFTYTVSHDLKSPLVTITGFLGFLEKDALAGNSERVKGTIIRITNAAYKMQTLLNDLLELSRIGRLVNAPEDIPFETVVNEAVDRVRGRLDEINALIEIQRDLPMVHGDFIRLVEVVQNLVDNAAKYSNPKERARIEIGTQEDDQKQSVFFVRDNGIGIPPEFHEKIFGLFDKLNAMSEGTGIGLTLVKRIIEVHGGKIWLESERDHGTTFYFTLPGIPDKE